MNQGSADSDALAFPPGKPPGPMMQTMGQSDAIDELDGATVHIGWSCEARERRQQDIFQNTALRQQLVVLKDETDVLISKRRQPRRGKPPWILAEDFNEPRGGLIKRAGDVQQSAFSTTGRSPNGNGSPRRHSEIDITKNGHCTRRTGKRANDILQIQDKRHYFGLMQHRKTSGNPDHGARMAGPGDARQRPALWSTLKKPQLKPQVETTEDFRNLRARPQPVDK